MDFVDWRSQVQPDSRQRIVNKIMETLKRHLPVSGQEGLHELRKIAIRFEEKIYTAATSQSDYLRKISLKMLTMETKSQNPIGNALPSNSAGNSNKSPVAGKRKKVRKREVGEPIDAFKVSKKGTAMRCGNCFQWGHNQRTCKAPDNPNKEGL
ncbi:hypothetical protein ACB098_05G074000 [Castanea mollissima]